MQKMVKVSLVIVFMIAGVYLFLPPRAEAVSATANAESAASSQSLYRTHCASCHGNNGKSQTSKGRKLEADDLTTTDVKADSIDKIVRIISNGKGDMPAFKKKLSKTQLTSIANYIKTL